jgi:MFS family permease
MSTMRSALGRFGAIAIALICVQLDYFALALALPNMAEDLHTTPENLQWSVSAYMIALGIAMVPGSRLADLVGRKKIVLIGRRFRPASLVWAVPPADSVIAARIVQGLGAGLYFLCLRPRRNATTDQERPKMLGPSGLAGTPPPSILGVPSPPRSAGAGSSSSMCRSPPRG